MGASRAAQTTPFDGVVDGVRRFAAAHPVLTSTPLLGLVAAILTWPGGPVGPKVGLDPSWHLGLVLGTERGLDFGRELIWTHGPLGFLQGTVLANGWLWFAALVYRSAIHIALCVSLVWAARRNAVGVVALPVALYCILTNLVEDSVVLALIWAIAALSPDGPRFARPLVLYAGPLFAAIEVLGKANRGGTVLILLGICLLAMDDRRRNLPVFAAIFAVTYAFFWAITAQDFGAIAEYLSNQLQVVSGFAEAHAFEDPAVDWQKKVAPLAALAFLLLAWLGFRDSERRTQVGVLLVVAVFCFTTFKQGFVRHDAGHGIVFFSTMICGSYALLWRLRPDAVVAAAATLLATAALAAVPGNALEVNPVDHVRALGRQVHATISQGKREEVMAAARQTMVGVYGVDAGTLRTIGQRPVHVDPWEIGVAWAYGLNWKPLPVFQDQQAYTAELEERNVEALESPDGPELILRQNHELVDPTYPTGAIDGDLGAFDPPRGALAMLCNFKPIRTTERWQVLARGADRCGPEREIETVRTRFGEPVGVPEGGPGELVIARVRGAEVGGLEKLRSFLYRPYGRTIAVDGVSYGLNPGTAASGMLLRAPAGADFPAPFALSPQAKSIAVGSLSGSTDPIEVEFEAIPIEAGGPAGRRGGP